MARDPQHPAVTRRRFLELAAIAAASAACGGPTGAGGTATATTAAAAGSASATALTLGTPEKSSITWGIRLPAFNSQIVPYIAEDKGWFRDVGLNEVKIVTTEQVSAGLVGGGLDIGVDQMLDLADAVNKGLPTRVIGAFRNYTVNMIAVQKEIASPKDLEGKDVSLGGAPGTADALKRLELLKQAGWDFTNVKMNVVNPGGGSDAAVRLFLDKKLWMTTLFNRHRNNVIASGAKLVVDRFDWGNDSMAATESFVRQNPNTVAAFWVAMIKAYRFWRDLANKDYVLALGEKKGFKITQDTKDAYEYDVRQYDDKGPLDGGFDPNDLRTYLSSQMGAKTPDLKSLLMLGPLNTAQRYLGITPRPVL